MESVLIARRLAAIAVLLRRYDGMSPSAIGQHPEMVAGYERACAEVSALLNLPPAAAGRQVHYAEVLDIRLPRLAALFAEGRIDWRSVQIVIDRTDLVDDDLIGELDEKLASRIENWSTWSRQRIINAVDAAVLDVDADAVRQRRKDADDNRYIWVGPDRDGIAKIDGRVPAASATAFDRRLTELAQAVCAEDPRNLVQRRADALAALTEGRSLRCGCGRADCPTRSAPAESGGTRVILNVIATDATVAGAQDRPGYLDGYGVIDAEQVRQLAAGASWRLLNPAADPAAAFRYQPSAALARAVRCRDLTCRFPGCHRRATICDLDHTNPFNHTDPAAGGPTVLSNLKCLCRFHHRMKTFGGWHDQQLEDGTVIWKSPSGAVFETKPGSAEVIPELADALGTTGQRPLRQPCQNWATQRAAQVARARRNNRVREAANELHAQRRREIADLKVRNRMRDRLHLLKGGSSTSPFCAWVNDPHEPEQLPPDWQPPPAPPPLPDDCPF
ncbi:HNH endonuclease signature motif containing protein [Mycolicibacter acidiphilus]|nr:HNH endonuclease signature motif containing protein [Mycolicibacter acidiphilus]